MPACLRFASCLLILAVAACSSDEVWLDDRAGVLSESQAKYLNDFHRHLLEDHDIDYRVVIESGGEDVNMRAVRLFEDIGVGGRSQGGRGLLLLLDPSQDQVRIEVSRALEGVYPDALIIYLETRQMVPFFRRGRVADGVAATTELIVTRAQEAAANQAFDPSTLPAVTAGGGARTEAELNAGPQARDTGGRPQVMAMSDPRETVRAYLQAMSRRNDRADLDIYTADTQALMAGWTVTPAQMDNIVKSYRGCDGAELVTSVDGARAVIRYPMDQRQCAPWFLRLEDGVWRLDFVVMQKVVRFGRHNAWRIELSEAFPYSFAFMDWAFDGNGYPRSTQKFRWGLSVGTYAEGTFVSSVQPGSAAEAFGFRRGDRLRRWNGEPVRDHNQAISLMRQVPAGAEQNIEVDRQGQHIMLRGPAPERPAG